MKLYEIKWEPEQKEEKRCLCLSSQPVRWPKDVGPTSVKGWESHSPSVPCEVLWKVTGGWSPNLFPIPVFPHPSRGWKYQKKIREIRKREKELREGWLCYSVFWEMVLQRKYFRDTTSRNLGIVILKKRSKVGGLTLTNFKIYYQTLEIKTTW